MLGGGVYVQEETWILSVPHVCPHLSHRHHVLDQLLDQTWGSSSPSDTGGDIVADIVNTACQQSEVSTSCILYQGTCFLFFHTFVQSKVIQTKIFGIIWVQISISDVSINVYNGIILNNKHKEQMNFSLQLQR